MDLSTPPAPAPKLLDLVRDRIRVKHYSIRTEVSYVQWIKRFILFHGKRHQREMGAAEVAAFWTHLAVAGNLSASAQNQALSVLLFLYREVLGMDLPDALAVKYPHEPLKWPWQYVFVSGGFSTDPRSSAAASFGSKNYCGAR